MIVAYQGVRGAYSEAALRKHFGARATALPCALSEQVFEAVSAGRADYGIVPVENTIAGNVSVNGDLFLKRDVFAVGECYLPIDHCLLAARGSKISSIRKALSHPVALAQCREFLERHGIEGVPEYDTAGSAELVARRRAKGEAAIASKVAGKAYGLSVLARNIQTHRVNITRFLAFTRPGGIPAGLKMEKTSLAFATSHRPGALLHCLQIFARAKINLSRLESRPIPENPFAYVFQADIAGGLHSDRVRKALAKLRREAKMVKIIGSYPAGRP
jgi:prephenate dehydratase